ncbi:MAG: hypothetical protein ACOC8B_03580, partial [Gemmatimonadota bacterium]
MRHVGRITLALAAVLTPAPLAAQAFCSAPHSSPVLAQSGSVQTLPPGQGWVQLTAFGQRTDEFFNTAGDTQPLLADGEAMTTSVFLTAAAGVFPGVDVWAQLPVHRLRYDDLTGARSRTGFGDVRIAARVSAAVAGIDGLPLAVRAGAKLPGSRFPVDATILPLSEGQRDWELSVETGYASAQRPVYVIAWVGHRWRAENERVARKPGDERFAHLALGGSVDALRWEVAVEGLWAEPPRQQGVELEASRRQLI